MSEDHATTHPASDAQLERHLAGVCAQRGTTPYFDRFESVQIDSGSLKLQLEIIETENAKATVVFMPGTNAYALLYGDFLTRLADRGYHVVGFDPRGHGRSEGARGSYTVPELVSDLQRVVAFARERFGGPVFAAGSSQGGIAAFYLAATDAPIAGAICHNLADLGAADSVELIRYPALGRLMAPLLPTLGRLFPELRVPMTAYLDLAREPVAGMGSARDVLYSDPLLVPYVRLKTLASLGSAPLAQPVEAVTTPIMVLQAGRDTIFPTAYIERIHARLNCRKSLKIYPELPHYMIVDHVDAFIDDVSGWIDAVSTPADDADS